MIITVVTDGNEKNNLDGIDPKLSELHEELIYLKNSDDMFQNTEIKELPLKEVIGSQLHVSNVFYTSDVVIIVINSVSKYSVLIYHIGVRQNLNRLENIVIAPFNTTGSFCEMKNALGKVTKIISYIVTEDGRTVSVNEDYMNSGLMENANIGSRLSSGMKSLYEELSDILSEIGQRTKETKKDIFIADLRGYVDLYKDDELKNQLKLMRRRLDDPELLSTDIILNMLLSYQKCDSCEDMVKLVEDVQAIPSHAQMVELSVIQYLYAFALNRLNGPGHRDKALEVINRLLQTVDPPSSDMYGLLGRIHKDIFAASDYKDNQALSSAIEAYKTGFHSYPSEYLGINLATLLVIRESISGKKEDVRSIYEILNLHLGRKGILEKLTDYWDLATFFEVRVLEENYSSAIAALKRMYQLNPPLWQLNSTISNIELICQFRSSNSSPQKHARKAFDFWMEFFGDIKDLSRKPTVQSPISSMLPEERRQLMVNLKKSEPFTVKMNPFEVWEPGSMEQRILFPILVFNPATGDLEPNYVQVNLDTEPKSLEISPLDGDESQNITITSKNIRSLNIAKGFSRTMIIYTWVYPPQYYLSFACEGTRDQCHSVVRNNLLANWDQSDLSKETTPIYQYEYDIVDGQRVVLGRGSFGTVFAGRECISGSKVAIKELRVDNPDDYQPLLEEIKLHRRLKHRNIVRYMSSDIKNDVLSIIMEQVPGGSLSSLIRTHGCFMESQVQVYSVQILRGIKYLHDNRIVHRDIKADNILVNMYKGELKIADFGASKRLFGLFPRAKSFKGTMQYMAPELINVNVGYSYKADIWSFGCTVVEMLTGEKPFADLCNPLAAIYNVGLSGKHPTIPETASDQCKAFLARTFEPDSNMRASASELLDDVFLRSSKVQRRNAFNTYESKREGKCVDPSTFTRSQSHSVEETVSNHLTQTDSMKHIDHSDSTRKRQKKSVACYSPDQLHRPPPITPPSLPDMSNITEDSWRNTPTPLVNDAFSFVKQDEEARAELVTALRKEQRSILTNWHEAIVQKENDRLPPFPINRNVATDPELSLDQEHLGPIDRTDAEKQILERLFGMLVAHLEGDASWENIEQYLVDPLSKLDHVPRDSPGRHLAEALHQIRARYGEETKYFRNLSWLHVFSHSSILQFWNTSENFLRPSLRAPHQYMAWHCLVSSAVGTALKQIRHVLETNGQVDVRKNGILRNRSLRLRRHPTFSVSARRKDPSPDSLTANRKKLSLSRPSSMFVEPKRFSSFKSTYQGRIKRMPSRSLMESDDIPSKLEEEDSNDDQNQRLKILKLPSEEKEFSTKFFDQSYTDLSTGFASLTDWFHSLKLPQKDLLKLNSHNITDEGDFLFAVSKDDLWRMELSGYSVLRIWRHVEEIRYKQCGISMTRNF